MCVKTSRKKFKRKTYVCLAFLSFFEWRPLNVNLIFGLSNFFK